MTDPQNPLGMKSLSESMQKPITQQWGEIYKQVFTMDWIFDKLWEKAFIIGCIGWAMFSIGRFVYGLF